MEEPGRSQSSLMLGHDGTSGVVMVEMDFEIAALLLVMLLYWLKKKLCPHAGFLIVLQCMGIHSPESQSGQGKGCKKKKNPTLSKEFHFGVTSHKVVVKYPMHKKLFTCSLCPIWAGWVGNSLAITSKSHLRGTPWVLDPESCCTSSRYASLLAQEEIVPHAGFFIVLHCMGSNSGWVGWSLVVKPLQNFISGGHRGFLISHTLKVPS